MTDPAALDPPSPSVPDRPRSFRYDGEVRPGETRHLRYEVGETYHGAPVEVPVTIVNGVRPGPRLFVSAAIHGDELNGVKVAQEVAARYDPTTSPGRWSSSTSPTSPASRPSSATSPSTTRT